ncbi:MAG: PASTA domain-containing protein, partial [Clostridia bacterium]
AKTLIPGDSAAMLTGKVPFDADTSVSVALKQMQENPVPPMEINENIPKAVNDIILKAMEKEPMTRYQTATAMLRDLSRALKEPDGDFVEEENFDDGLTRRMGAITDDMVKKSSTNSNKKKQNKKGNYFEEHPKMKILLIILICLVVFFGSIGITSVVLNNSTPKDVQIPELVGLTEQEAQAKLEELKLKYEKIGEEYNTEYEAGKIFEQSPSYSANYKIKENTTISVKVSKGTETTIVPKVAGMTYDEAVAALEEKKLKAEKVEETSKEIKEGIVISQEIEANTTVNAGDTIKLHVSIGTGIPQVVMPNVVGHTEESAKSTLESKNLKVNVEYKEDTSKNNGEVLEQSIKSGENIDEGTEVTITVNKLAVTKSANLIVNVKSITGGYEESTNEVSETIKKKKLTIKVGEDKVYEKEVDLNTTNVQQKIEGKGTVTVKVYIDDILKKQLDVDFSKDSYTIE